ncbi:MAG: benzoyl-CoA 2,3-epoxidase subunit BoxB, partial [Acidobacteria bacterium]|nr:benzoyl-CoA 2,3-epoxidase subunit BoxB [Acidobacteriota bacterium]
RFMLTEEAFHMFVGESGVTRIVQRTCEAMREAGLDDPTDIEAVRALGVIDLPTIQKKVNLHYSLTLDLFGSELSTNSANFFNAGLKGRFREHRLEDDHRLLDDTYGIPEPAKGAAGVNGGWQIVQHPALNALNARLRDDFTADCNLGVGRWNKAISQTGFDFAITLPHVAFHRQIGVYRDLHATPAGELISEDAWTAQRGEWLPDDSDRAFIESLMKPEFRPGHYASWIAEPRIRINHKPGDFEWVKLAEA